MDRQRVHIRAEPDRAVALPGAQHPDHAPTTVMHLDPDRPKTFGDTLAGMPLLESQFGIAMKRPPQRRQPVVEIRNRPRPL